jgi:hypothetical protein
VFQSQVGKLISALRKDREDKQFRSLYLGFVLGPWFVQFPANETLYSYLKAQDWQELAAAAYESLNYCAVDKMVRLIQGQPSSSTSDGLTVVQFSSKRNLLSQYIQSPLVFDIRKSKLRPTAKPFVPRSSVESATPVRAPSPAPNEQVFKNTGRVEPVATISLEDIRAPATPEEIKAAITIQVAYRRALRRREDLPSKDGRVKLWYDQCIDAQTHLQGPKTYSKYFLGPLVHVLIWADALVRLLKNRRERVKKKLHKNVDHIQLEDLMERMTMSK